MESKPARTSEAASRILAVLVLYGAPAAQSPAYRALKAAREASNELARRLSWIICDNSPDLQPRPPAFEGLYVQDLVNAGLAPRYNFALEQALAEGCEWLLLLDQDTQLTDSYLSELLSLSAELASSQSVVAIVPKLIERDKVLSPHLPVAVSFQTPDPIGLSHSGVLRPRAQAFNSGALLRTHALRAIGGFPEHFWLDYLDHATFYLLQAAGGKIFLMQSKLEHALSTNPAVRIREASVGLREGNILKASRDYYWMYGSGGEKISFFVQQLRVVAGALRHREFARFRQLLRILCSRKRRYSRAAL